MVCVIMLESQEVVTINEKSVIITNHRESFGRSLFKVKLKRFGSKAFVFTVSAKSPKNFAQKDIRSLNELLVSICVNLAFTPFT